MQAVESGLPCSQSSAPSSPSIRAIVCRPSLTRNQRPRHPSQAHRLGSPLAVLTTIWPLPWAAWQLRVICPAVDPFSGCGLLCPPQDNSCPKACGRVRRHPACGPAWTLEPCLCQAGFFLGQGLPLSVSMSLSCLYFYYLYTEQK